jgi:hypothetical protein
MTTAAPLTLFDDETPTVQAAKTKAPERPAGVYGLRPAEAHLVTTRTGDPHHPELRPRLYLVVHCPYCDHQHIHPAGHTGEPRLCLRNSRCIGQTNGAYYFPAVHQ